MANPVVECEIRAADPYGTRSFFGKPFGWTLPGGGMPGYSYVDTGVARDLRPRVPSGCWPTRTGRRSDWPRQRPEVCGGAAGAGGTLAVGEGEDMAASADPVQLARAIAGDDRAIAALVERYQRPVSGTATACSARAPTPRTPPTTRSSGPGAS